MAWQVVSFARTGDVPSPIPSSEPGAPTWLMYRASRWLLLGALAWSWWYTWRRRLDLLPSILTVTVVFYVAAGGFGLHYLVWAVPFALIARDRWLRPYTLAATAALLAAYALRSDIYGSIPPVAWPPETAAAREFVARAATLPAWLVCGLWARALIRRARGPRDGSAGAW